MEHPQQPPFSLFAPAAWSEAAGGAALISELSLIFSVGTASAGLLSPLAPIGFGTSAESVLNAGGIPFSGVASSCFGAAACADENATLHQVELEKFRE